MHYILVVFLVIIGLVILLSNDHDRSYDKKERRMTLPPEQPRVKPEAAPQPKPEPAPKPQPKPQPKPEPKPQPQPQRTLTWTYLYGLDYDGSLPEETMETEVTGMRYYCSLADVGPVNGIIRPEPDNPHDARAQAVIRADGKKIGYIPRYALDEYENFNDHNVVCPFAGAVSVDNKGYMMAFILVTLPVSRDFVKKELTGYVGVE